MTWRGARPIALLGLLLAVTACKGDETKSDKPDERDAGPNAAAIDPNIAGAVQSAGLQPGAPGAPAAGGELARPLTGVFGPGEADRAHGKGAPIAVEMLGTGNEPRVKLRPAMKLDGEQTMVMQVAKRFQTQMLPKIDYTLGVKVSAPKGGDDDAPAAGPSTIRFKIKKAKASQQQQGAVPPELDKQLGKLKGSVIKAKLAADGSVFDERIEFAKGAEQALGELVIALSETLVLFFSPLPDEPVGVGGYWIAHDRTMLGGMDMVRYRVTKLEKLEGTQAALSVDVRYYASDSTQLPSAVGGQAGQKLVLLGLEALGQVAMTRDTAKLLPTSGTMKLPLVLKLGDDPAQPQRAMPVQIESAAGIIPAGGASPAPEAPPAPGAPPPPAAPPPAAPPPAAPPPAAPPPAAP